MVRRGFLEIVHTENGIQKLLAGRDPVLVEPLPPPTPCHDQAGPS